MASLVYIGKDGIRPTYKDYKIIYEPSRFEVDITRINFLLPEERKFLAHQLGMKDWEKLTEKELNNDDWINNLSTHALRLTTLEDVPETEVLNPTPIYFTEYLDEVKEKEFVRMVGGLMKGLYIRFNNKGIPRYILETFPDAKIGLFFDNQGKITEVIFQSYPYEVSEIWNKDGTKTSRYYINKEEVSKNEYQMDIKQKTDLVEERTHIISDIARSIIGGYLG